MKIKLTILSIILCFSFCFLSFAQNNPHIEVLYISGTPKVSPANETKYIKAEEGMYLEAGDKIKTDGNSSLGLGFDDDEKNIIEVGNDSDVVVILGESEKLDLLEGRVFATIDNLSSGQSFEVRTPTAVTGVRGTYWTVIAVKDSTDVETIDGDVYVAGFLEDGRLSQERIIVVAGYQTTVERFRSPLPPRKIPRRTLENRRNIRAAMRKRAAATRPRRRMPSRLNRLRNPSRQPLRTPIRRVY